MLDIKLIRNNEKKVKQALEKRGIDVNFDEFLILEKERRKLIGKGEGLKAEKNRVSSLIPKMKKNNEDVSEIFLEMKKISQKTKEIDQKLSSVDSKINDFIKNLPNMP